MFHPVSSKIMSPMDNPMMNRGMMLPGQGNGPSTVSNPMDRTNPNQPGQPGGAVGQTQQAENNKPMVAVSPGSASCLGCVGMKNGMIPLDKLEELKTKMYDEIMAHEMAHSSAAGAFGGAIHIDYDANGIAVGGHVPIMIPGLSKMNPEESLKAFETIYNAAMAPGDPSGQDMSVAAQAQDLMGRAKVMMDAKSQREAKMAMSTTPGAKQPNQPGMQMAGMAGQGDTSGQGGRNPGQNGFPTVPSSMQPNGMAFDPNNQFMRPFMPA